LYEIKISKKVSRFLKKRPLWLSQRFEQALEQLRQNPFRSNLDIRKLAGFENDYRLRIGKYRFLFTVFKNDFLIFLYDADTRGDIYKG